MSDHTGESSPPVGELADRSQSFGPQNSAARMKLTGRASARPRRAQLRSRSDDRLRVTPDDPTHSLMAPDCATLHPGYEKSNMPKAPPGVQCHASNSGSFTRS